MGTIRAIFCVSDLSQGETVQDSTSAYQEGRFKIDEYLVKIKVCVDSLASIGVSLSTKDHVESILDGLPSDYESFVTSVTLRNDDFSIEAILMAYEFRVEKNNGSLDSSSSAHVL